MAKAVKVDFIGWEDDFRYAEEKSRITSHIQDLAHEKDFGYACVQDMIMRYRYRCQGPFMDVHFKRADHANDKHVAIRLWFNEDGDLCKEPEILGEVNAQWQEKL